MSEQTINSPAENKGRLIFRCQPCGDPFLGFDFGRCNRLRRKLEHRCFLTFKGIS